MIPAMTLILKTLLLTCLTLKNGIDKALKDGVKFGRRRKLSQKGTAELRMARGQGVTIKTSMATYNLSKVGGT